MYITKTTKITVHATADDWQLYDLPGREDAAIDALLGEDRLAAG